jgi:hypothetical protein
MRIARFVVEGTTQNLHGYTNGHDVRPSNGHVNGNGAATPPSLPRSDDGPAPSGPPSSPPPRTPDQPEA